MKGELRMKLNAKWVKTRLSENIGGSKRNAIRKKNAYRFGLRAK